MMVFMVRCVVVARISKMARPNDRLWLVLHGFKGLLVIDVFGLR